MSRRVVSLSTRLVLTLVGLLVLSLSVAVGATFGALQDWKNNQNNDVLSAVGRQLQQELSARGGDPRLDSVVSADDVSRLLRGMAERGDVPSFFEIRDPDGRIVQSVALGSTPAIPDPLPAGFRPPDDLGGETFARAQTARPGGASGEPNWLLRSARLTDRGDILLVGMRTSESDELINRTANVAIVSSAVALITVALLASRTVRRGLRPLVNIANTAAAIGAGDLTRRVESAEPRTEVGQLGIALNGMLGQIESAFRKRKASEDRLRRFVADASHELRTPVATIRGYAELFRRGAQNRPDDLAKVMRRIESEAARMGSLVDELLLLARLDQGRPLEHERVDLAELAADALADAQAAEPERPLTLHGNGPVVVRGDALRLRQVMGNLLSNVLQHTPAGTPAGVRVEVQEQYAVVEVTDQGPGLTEEHQEQVFERFFRVDGSRSREHGGVGLGLAIVAAVTAAHSGDVSVTSEPGKGATFRVRIPRESAE